MSLSDARLNVVGQYDPDYLERLNIFEYSNGTIEFVGGMCLEILLALQFSLNFSYKALKGNGWGGVSPNGTWEGISEQLINNYANISIAQSAMHLSIDELEHGGISFLHVSSYGLPVAYFRQPKASAYKNLIISSYSKNSWNMYFILWVFISLTMYNMIYFIQRIFKSIQTKENAVFKNEIVLWAISTACKTGWYRTACNSQCRIVYLTAYILAFVWYIGYSAGITVNLLTEVRPIRNIQQLTFSTVNVFAILSHRRLLQSIYSERKIHVQIGTKVISTNEEGLSKAINSQQPTPIAFITFADAVNTVFHRLNFQDSFLCDVLSSVVIPYGRTPGAMKIKRGSPLKEPLNRSVLIMTERGILAKLNKQYDRNTQLVCSMVSTNYRGGLSLDDLWTSCFILLVGFFTGVVSIVCEIVFFYFHAQVPIYLYFAQHE